MCEQLKISVKADSAILINAETKAVLFEKNAYTKQFPASITKIATAAYVLKEKRQDLAKGIKAEQESIASISSDAKQRGKYTAPAYWIELGSSHIGIKKGEELTLKDLLYGMLVATANDASNVIAQYVGNGSIPKFMNNLNCYVAGLGCRDTYFMNPHGLHHPKHQSTAYDMAIITCEALKDPIFREIVKTVRYNPKPISRKLPS